MLAPVILFIYKRPKHTMATLNALSKNTLAAQTRLFVFSDGPKDENERETVESVRKLIRDISGFRSVTLILRDIHMGLGGSVISGVSEVLEGSGSVIVLEDDLETAPNFLEYMNNALAHYKDDPDAFSVTGHTFPANYLRIPSEYSYHTYAAYRCSSWSWGTWRNRWQKVDWEVEDFPTFMRDQEAQARFNQGGQDMTKMLTRQRTGQTDSWAIRFCYAHHTNHMRCIYPTKTLVRNIGLDSSGTHSKPDSRFQHPPLDTSWLPRNFCPAKNVSTIIARDFRKIFDLEKKPLTHKMKNTSKKLFQDVAGKALVMGSKIKEEIYPDIHESDVLIVNTYQKLGGSARVAYKMYRGIKDSFPNTKYHTLFKEDKDKRVVGLLDTSIRGAVAHQLMRFERQPLNEYPNRMNAPFSPNVCPNFLRVRLSRFRSKLVHLHWITNGLLNVEELTKLSCPMVWTLHDTWAFTGGCHYTENCDGFKRQCGACPQLGSASTNDISHSLMKRKTQAYKDLNLTIVTPSRWLADVACQSSLFSSKRIEVIPNGLDTDIFKPVNRAATRDYLGIGNDQTVVAFGAQSLNNPRKGSELLCAALSTLNTMPVTLVTFGEGRLPLENASHVTVRSFDTVTDDRTLALAYSAADAFLCPSREDNLPNTVAEALACGTPCIAFDVNGLPEMIEHKVNGWLAHPFDPSELAEGIKWVATHSQPEHLRKAARTKALKEYGLSTMIERYTALYRELIPEN